MKRIVELEVPVKFTEDRSIRYPFYFRHHADGGIRFYGDMDVLKPYIGKTVNLIIEVPEKGASR